MDIASKAAIVLIANRLIEDYSEDVDGELVLFKETQTHSTIEDYIGKTVMMSRAAVEWAPEYWSKLDDEQTTLSTGSEEFQQIAFEVRHAICNYARPIGRIIRLQNVYDFAQCLVRGQLLTAASSAPLHRVRRFIKIPKQDLPVALQWNLDHRRCNLPGTVFRDIIPYNTFSPGDILLIVQVLTKDKYASVITPGTTLEYFIDYIVYL